MHILDTYAYKAGNLGISQPFLNPHFFPLPFERYITIQNGSGANAKNYSYWSDVCMFLLPILKQQDIKIVQLGSYKEPKIKNSYDLRGKTNLRQAQGILQNSLLHLGNDSSLGHFSSALDIPTLILISTSYPENCQPYFGNKYKVIIPKEGKPTFSADEGLNPRINTISIESVLEGIESLTSWSLPKIQSIYRGDKYREEFFEAIPNSSSIPLPEQTIVNVRMDYKFDEQGLSAILSNRNAAIITDRPINLDLLNHFKDKLGGIIYTCTGTEEEFKFINKVKALCPILLQTRALETEHLKLLYMEIGEIYQIPKINIDKTLVSGDNVFYRTNKIIFEGAKMFATKEDWQLGRELRSLFVPFNYKNIEEELVFGYVFKMD